MVEKQGWRKQGRTPSQRSRSAESDAVVWQTRRPRESQDSLMSHRLRLGGLATVCLLLVGWLVYAWLMRPVDTPIIALVATDYRFPAIAPNDYAREDLVRLQKVAKENDDLRTPDAATLEVTKDVFLTHLQESLDEPPGGPGKNAFLIYISTHGLLDEKAEPCLLTADSHPLKSETWLPMREVLKLIDEKLAAHGKTTKAVVLLDCSHVHGQWSFGQLYNGFADGLDRVYQDLFGENETPRIFLINSTNSGQFARTAPELGGTVFGYFTAMGLDGAASRDGDPISLLGLHRYLRDQVLGWVSFYRGSTQEVRLVPPLSDDQDFNIAFARGGDAQVRIDEAAANLGALQKDAQDSWQRSKELWNRFGQLDRQRLSRDNPLGLAHLEQKLLRAERLSFAGAAYGQQLSSVRGEIEELLNSVPEPNLPARPALFSLPLSQSLSPIPAAEMTEAQSQLDLWLAPPGADGAKKPLPEKPPTYRAAASASWNWLAQRGNAVGQADLQTTLDFINRSPNGSAPDFVEIHTLRMLLAYLDWNADSFASHPNAVRDAIQVRSIAEVLSAPQDLRVHYWLHQPMGAADQQRRQAEDRLFVGRPETVQQGGEALSRLAGNDAESSDYARSKSLSADAAQWHGLRDAGWADIPYYAQWLLSRVERKSSASSGGIDDYREILNDPFFFLEQMITDLRGLDVALGRAIDDGGQAHPEGPAAAAAKFAPRYRLLKQYYEEHCDTLLTAPSNEVLLRDILDALATPLLEPERRATLGDKALAIMFNKSNPAEFGEDELPDLEREAKSRAEFMTALAANRRLHPVLQMTRRDDYELLNRDLMASTDFEKGGNYDPLLWLAKQGKEVRWLLSNMVDAADQLEKVTDDRLRSFGAGGKSETSFHARFGLAEAERLTRSTGILFSPYKWNWGGDPVARLRAVDWHFLCGWHCQRTLDDFWGPRPDAGRKSGYFDDVARLYLQAAKAMDNKATRLYFDGKSLEELRSSRVAALSQNDVQPSEVMSTGAGGPRGLEGQTIKITWGSAMPAGMAAVFLHSQPGLAAPKSLLPVQQRPGGEVRRHGVPVEPGKTVTVRHEIPLNEISDIRSTYLYATGLFRGNLRTREFGFQVSKPLRLIAQLLSRPNATVKVKGDERRRGHIMFIVDGSGSMRKSGRMDRAKTALRTVLGLLQAEGGYQVGLRAYGNRYRFRDIGGNRTDETVEDRSKPGVFAKRSASLGNDPDLDTSSLVPLTEIRKAAGMINGELDKLGPWGQTPLYLSMQQALQDDAFTNVPRDDPKHLVVLTDGKDELYDQSKKVKIDQNFINQFAARGVALHVVGMELNENEQGIVELRGIVSRVKGSYYNSSNLNDLIDSLRASLHLWQFSVAPGGQTTPQRKNLGETWPLSNINSDGQDYTIQVHGNRTTVVDPVKVTLSGGEALQLVYDRSDFALAFERYAPKVQLDAAKRELPKQQRTFEFTVEANHAANALHFDISVQDVDLRKFTDRPKYVWVEIDPGTGGGRTYQFSDLEFVDERPVPVMRFSASDWPRVESANIRLWVRFDPILQPTAIELDPNGDASGIRDGKGQLLFKSQKKDDPNYMIIEVVEDRALTGELSPAHVRLLSPRPRQVEHLFSKFADGREIITHRFSYDKGAALPIVNIVPRREIQDSAVYVEFRNVRTPLK